jgi:hypothetical protein
MWKHSASSTGNLMDMLSVYIYIYILHRLLGRLWVIVNVVPTCGNKQQPKIYKQVIWI